MLKYLRLTYVLLFLILQLNASVDTYMTFCYKNESLSSLCTEGTYNCCIIIMLPSRGMGWVNIPIVGLRSDELVHAGQLKASPSYCAQCILSAHLAHIFTFSFNISRWDSWLKLCKKNVQLFSIESWIKTISCEELNYREKKSV